MACYGYGHDMGANKAEKLLFQKALVLQEARRLAQPVPIRTCVGLAMPV